MDSGADNLPRVGSSESGQPSPNSRYVGAAHGRRASRKAVSHRRSSPETSPTKRPTTALNWCRVNRQAHCAHAPTSNTRSIAPMPAASSTSSFTDLQMYPLQPIIVILAAVLSFTGTTAAHPEPGSDSGTVPASTPAYSKATTPMAAVITSCVKPNTIALTFDDGPFIYMRNISDLFAKYDARATFFVNGNNYDSPDVVGNLRYAFEAGHQIASHTWSHPNLEKCSSDEIHSEITLLNTALLEILGIKTQFIRPPYGNYNTLVRQVVAQHNMSLVVWDFDSGDSVGEAWPDSEKDYEAEFEKHVTNLIALNHETEVNTVAEVVPWVLPELLSKGYKPVTVAECLGVEPYTFVGSFGERDSSWTCKKD